MLNKKTSNAVSVVVALWGLSIVGLLLLKYAEGLVLDQGAFALWLVKVLAVALIPLLIIYANKRSQSSQPTGFEWALQIIFYVLWAVLGMTFLLGQGGTYLLALVAALAILLVILLKAATGPKVQKKQRKTDEGLSVSAVLVSLSVLTVWAPVVSIAGIMFYNSSQYSAYPMAGLMIIPVYATLAPLLIAGTIVSAASALWSIREFLVKRVKGKKAVTLHSIWLLASVAYLAVWAWYIMPILVNFQLLFR